MVRWPAAAEAAAYAREHSDFGVGLHLDLGEWAYEEGAWTPVYEVVPADDASAVKEETARQLVSFRRLVGRDPTHLDSHQHVHRHEPARSILIRLARRLAVPLRHYTPGVRHCGDFYGQTATGLPVHDVISVEGLIRILDAVAPGVTELACHPGLGDDAESVYRDERTQEVKVLCDPHLQAAIIARKIELFSFGDSALREMNLVP
jgi:predicted glycoside hydrolase/deacetylase ChbG (UPF0249 family)